MDSEYILNTFLFLISGILVMWMAAGFTMLEVGLTRTKNSTTILTKNIGLFAISSMIYYIIGYNIMYGSGNDFMGYGFFLNNTSSENHSLSSDFFFQIMFVATAASVISGTIAERMKMIPFFIFIIFLSAFIYPIQGHWVWAGTLTGENGILEGFSDFAGSTIVHSVGGWAALAAVLILGARKGKYLKDGKIRPIPGSNLTLATLGTFILWMGWFGFNGGSQLAMGTKDDIDAISQILVNTNMGAISGIISTILLSLIIFKKIDLTMILNGALAGLVSVTAGPNLSIEIAIIEGLIGGALAFGSIILLDKIKIDDPVGALSVHLVAGIWGTLAVGIFNPDVTILAQIKGIIIIGTFVFISSLIIWKILDILLKLRVSESIEYDGLDIHETGLEAYPEFTNIKK